jgi:signal transduction histidine kinase
MSLWGYLLVAAAAFSLAWWRAAPLFSLAGSVVLASAYLLIGFPFGPIQLCMVLAMAATAYRRPLGESAVACGVAAAISTASVAPRLGGEAAVLGLLAWTSWLIVPWCVGALVQVSRSAASRSRQELVKRAALTERIRLAQDIHDAAGHGLAVIAMQAGIAQLVFDEQPEQARASLRAIDETSRAALKELRETLASVADPDQPVSPDRDAVRRLGLDEIPNLIERVRGAGLTVGLNIAGNVAEALPEPHHTVIYRVVQESLTNVLQHSGADSASVEISRDDDVVDVRVSDSGAGRSATRGGGRGLVGMRTRVASLGGTVEAGPAAARGFVVHARLPVADPSPTEQGEAS